MEGGKGLRAEKDGKKRKWVSGKGENRVSWNGGKGKERSESRKGREGKESVERRKRCEQDRDDIIEDKRGKGRGVRAIGEGMKRRCTGG